MQTRILDIYAGYSEYIRRLVPLQIEDEYLKIVIYFADGSNQRTFPITSTWGSKPTGNPLTRPAWKK